MAETRQRTPDPIEAEMDRAAQEMKMKMQRQSFDKKIKTLADRVILYRNKYGLEHATTKMLTRFLELALKMKELMDNVEAINIAMGCVTDAITLFDDITQQDQQLLATLADNKYGFFYELKSKWMAKRAVRNQNRRMRAFVSGLRAKLSMAEGMIKAMDSLSFDMDGKKKKGDTTEPATPLADNYLKEMGGGDGSGGSGFVPGGASGGSSSGGSSGGLTDGL